MPMSEGAKRARERGLAYRKVAALEADLDAARRALAEAQTDAIREAEAEARRPYAMAIRAREDAVLATARALFKERNSHGAAYAIRRLAAVALGLHEDTVDGLLRMADQPEEETP